MKITDVRIEKFFVPLREPVHVAIADLDNAENWLIKICTEDGLYGIGSATPASFVTGETAETCYLVLKMFAEALLGKDAENIAEIHGMMNQIIFGNGSSKCAVDTALYDLAGKRAGLPLYRLLGGSNPVVQNDITIGIDTEEKMVQDAQKYVSEKGFRILKVKVGKDLSHDIQVLNAIRTAIGPNVRLRIDANQGYTVEMAKEAIAEFDRIGIDAAEQLLPWWDLEGAVELKRWNPTELKLMMDESVHNIYDAKRAMQMGCADFYNIKLMKCGGLYQGQMIADLALKHGVGCMVGCMAENKISLTAGISLVAAKEAIVEADCDSFMLYPNEDDGIEGGFTRNGGEFILLEKPGLGIEMDF